MSQRRRNFTPEQKAELLRRHLAEKVPVSTICNENSLQPSLFYDWLRQLLKNAAAALATPKDTSRERQLEEKVVALEKRIARAPVRYCDVEPSSS